MACSVACLKIVAELDEFSALGAHRRVLFDGVSLRHHDDSAKPVLTGRDRNRLSMVPSRRRDDGTARRKLLAQSVHVDQAAAHLERSDRQMVLMLHPHRAARARVDLRPGVLRGLRQILRDQIRGGADLIHLGQ